MTAEYLIIILFHFRLFGSIFAILAALAAFKEMRVPDKLSKLRLFLFLSMSLFAIGNIFLVFADLYFLFGDVVSFEQHISFHIFNALVTLLVSFILFLIYWRRVR